MLAMVDLANPVMIAVIIGWVLSVILHEFAHGLVGHLGGDYTIRQRGGLTLNPLQYVDPVTSVVFPVVALALGGIPLPGGSTFIRRDLLRSKWWGTAVSLAGPAMNLLLFAALVLPLHPRFGWVDPAVRGGDWTHGQKFLATLAFFQFYSVCLNLLPIPPLDGFQAILPLMDEPTRERFSTPQIANIGFIVVFLLVMFVPAIQSAIVHLFELALARLGFDLFAINDLLGAVSMVVSGR